MKKIFLTLGLALASFIAFAQTQHTAIEIGTELPQADVKMENVNGGSATLSSETGKNGLLVMFSCNTCPYVVKNEKRTLEITEYAKKKNLGVIIINSNEAKRGDEDSKAAMKAYAQKKGYTVPYVIDEKSAVADAFGATKTPEVFLFNSDKVLVYRGAIDDNPAGETFESREHLKEAINELTAGKDITVKTSKSFGCSIKRVK